MNHSILVFNKNSLNKNIKAELRQVLLAAHFDTLCEQYQLDPAQIEPAKSSLEVLLAEGQSFPYFIVNYGACHHRPIIVYEWDFMEDECNSMKKELLDKIAINGCEESLSAAGYLLEIELDPVQLKDMGLLLAYEIARWAAYQGEGVILGLDDCWYHLNRHRAFVPVVEENGKI